MTLAKYVVGLEFLETVFWDSGEDLLVEQWPQAGGLSTLGERKVGFERFYSMYFRGLPNREYLLREIEAYFRVRTESGSYTHLPDDFLVLAPLEVTHMPLPALGHAWFTTDSTMIQSADEFVDFRSPAHRCGFLVVHVAQAGELSQYTIVAKGMKEQCYHRLLHEFWLSLEH